MNEDKPSQTDPTVTIGIVGHCRLSTVEQIKKFLDMLPDYYEVHCQVSPGKLWIVTGRDRGQR